MASGETRKTSTIASLQDFFQPHPGQVVFRAAKGGKDHNPGRVRACFRIGSIYSKVNRINALFHFKACSTGCADTGTSVCQVRHGCRVMACRAKATAYGKPGGKRIHGGLFDVANCSGIPGKMTVSPLLRYDGRSPFQSNYPGVSNE